MKRIDILGAGIAGLVTAISLKNFDKSIDVYVHEKREDVGSNHNNDFQQVENWVSRQDVIERVKDIGIDILPAVLRETYCMQTYSPNGKRFDLKSKTPLFYTVRRHNTDSLDDLLRQYALEKGVKISFNTKMKEFDVDVIATGARKVQGFACGYKFHTDLEDGIYGFLDDSIAPKDYAYVVVINREATLATVLFGKIRNPKDQRSRAFSRFKQLLGNFTIENLKEFSGYDAYMHGKTRQKNGRLYVGAAGGFQDMLFGFGIKQAIISGHLAAQSVCEGEDFDKLWKAELGKEHKNEIVARRLYDMLGNKGYEFMISSLSILQKLHDFDAKPFMRSVYNSPILRTVLYGHAEKYMLRKYDNTLQLK